MKKKKEYTLSTFICRAFVYPMIILYFVLQIADIGLYLSLPYIITRYIPVAIVAFLSTLFLYKTGIKKLHKNDAETVKKVGLIAPFLVATLLLLYGLYSVSVNVKEIKKSMNSYSYKYSYSSSLYDSVYGEGSYNRKNMDALEVAENEATIMWIVSSFIYAIFGEVAALISLKGLERKMLQDEGYNTDYSMNDTNNMFLGARPSYNSGYGGEVTDENPISPESGSSSINWNL